jgi:hypothetical protein
VYLQFPLSLENFVLVSCENSARQAPRSVVLTLLELFPGATKIAETQFGWFPIQSALAGIQHEGDVLLGVFKVRDPIQGFTHSGSSGS